MIRFRCSACQKGLAVGENLAGRAVKCPGCQAKIRVPAPEVEAVAEEAIQAPKKSVAAPPPKRRVLEDVEEEDDGRESRRPKRRRIDDDEDDSPRERKPKKKKKASRPGIGVFGLETFHLALLGIAAASLPLIGLSFFWSPIASLPALLGLGLLAFCQVWFLIVAFGEGAMEGVLCLLIPLYSLYFLVTHLEECKKPFLGGVVGGVILMLVGCMGAISSGGGDGRVNFRKVAGVDRGKQLVVGRDTIFYQIGTSEAQARALANALRQSNFFDDGPFVAQVARNGEMYIVSIPLPGGQWNIPEVVEEARKLRTTISLRAFGGSVVELRLCDEDFDVRKTIL